MIGFLQIYKLKSIIMPLAGKIFENKKIVTEILIINLLLIQDE
jgi:hypothetical protein